MGRVLGVDLGSRRIGLALSDSTAVVASPLAVLLRAGDRADDHRAILALAGEHDVTNIVVGLPLSLSTGRPGPAAESARAEASELAERAAGSEMRLRVDTFDERLTTVSAERALAAGGVRARERRRVVDKVAAAVMLQAWLDGPGRATRRGSGSS